MAAAGQLFRLGIGPVVDGFRITRFLAAPVLGTVIGEVAADRIERSLAEHFRSGRVLHEAFQNALRGPTMPMHDWTRVPAGIYHDFHNAWITHLRDALNDGVLPPRYYALGAIAEAAPRTQAAQETSEDLLFYLQRQRTVVIRHVSDDRIVALIEIISPANKHSRQSLEAFLDKVVAAFSRGIHVLVIDPFPPTPHDPDGIHDAIWRHLMAGNYKPPCESPLTLVAYCVGRTIKAWIEPFRVGSPLAEMPLFLDPGHYVNVSLEEIYLRAWHGVPARWKRVIAGQGSGTQAGSRETAIDLSNRRALHSRRTGASSPRP